MKKYGLIVLIFTLVFTLNACSLDANEPTDESPDLNRIRAICDLATYDLHFHNVAKDTKTAGTGVLHFGEHERKFWIEYSGSVKIGVDMSKGDMKVEDSTVKIYLPKAELLGTIAIDENQFQETISDNDGLLNSNPIQAKDASEALKKAQAQIKEKLENDEKTLSQARERAKKLIVKYIEQFNESVGTEYTVEFADEPFKAE